MSDRIRVRDLTGFDAVAMRAGPHAVVWVSDSLPRWARDAAADQLLRAVHVAPGTYATASLGLGEAARPALAVPSTTTRAV